MMMLKWQMFSMHMAQWWSIRFIKVGVAWIWFNVFRCWIMWFSLVFSRCSLVV